jgi:hypothetical protein
VARKRKRLRVDPSFHNKKSESYDWSTSERISKLNVVLPAKLVYGWLEFGQHSCDSGHKIFKLIG